MSAASPVPPAVWACAAAVLALRAVPFLASWLVAPPEGNASVLAPFALKDWLQYVALIRQGPGPFANPFTTEPQGHRIVLVFHQALGAVHAATGLDPFWLLELSRIPAVLAFTWSLWHLVAAVHVERRVRVWAAALVLLSGGLSFLGRWASALAPDPRQIETDLWTAMGWSTFDAAYNPVWMVGLALALLALRPLVQPGGPASRRDAAVVALATLGAWLVHPYSGVVVFAAAAGAAASAWVSGAGAGARLRRTALALAPAALFLAGLVAWQRGDPAYRSASAGFFGPQGLPTFWYPLTYAALGFFALRGLRRWAEARHPWRDGLAGWAGALAVLHTSTVVNGYHFVYALHLPLAVLAAPAVAEWFAAARGAAARALAARAAAAALLFSSALASTATDVAGRWHVGLDVAATLEALGRLPPGNVLSGAELGGLVPAFGKHRVYAGHWFMTPDYKARAELADRVTADPAGAADLRALVLRERIDYVVLAPAVLPAAAAAGVPITGAAQFGRFVVVSTGRR